MCFTILNQNEFRIATVAMFACDLYAGSPPPHDLERLRTTMQRRVVDFVRVGYFIQLNGPLNGHPPSIIIQHCNLSLCLCFCVHVLWPEKRHLFVRLSNKQPMNQSDSLVYNYCKTKKKKKTNVYSTRSFGPDTSIKAYTRPLSCKSPGYIRRICQGSNTNSSETAAKGEKVRIWYTKRSTNVANTM